jgi:hypothetical protein
MRFFVRFLSCLWVVGLVLATGCSSLNTSKSFRDLPLEKGKQNVCHVNASVSGLYFLGKYPLITGNTDKPGSWMPAFGKNTASLSETTDMVAGTAKEGGATELNCVVSSSRSIWIMPTFVLFWKTQTVSASGVK